jgi:hypothetical protein
MAEKPNYITQHYVRQRERANADKTYCAGNVTAQRFDYLDKALHEVDHKTTVEYRTTAFHNTRKRMTEKDKNTRYYQKSKVYIRKAPAQKAYLNGDKQRIPEKYYTGKRSLGKYRFPITPLPYLVHYIKYQTYGAQNYTNSYRKTKKVKQLCYAAA